MDVLILRLNAPLMSFGAPIIDRHGKIQPFPSLSLITGLLGNALGFDHSDVEKTDRLQERLRHASRQDRAGHQIRDYHTVNLSQSFMLGSNGWTTMGWLDERKGGAASKGTHIRLRDYRADSIHTVALTLQPEGEEPGLDQLQEALINPERPLFIGRKTCLPAAPLFVARMEVESLIDALEKIPLHKKSDNRKTYTAWWPADDQHNHIKSEIEVPVTDQRDWANQIHVGERWIARGEIQVKAKDTL